MKIARQDDGFRPVVITIETQQELNWMRKAVRNAFFEATDATEEESYFETLNDVIEEFGGTVN